MFQVVPSERSGLSVRFLATEHVITSVITSTVAASAPPPMAAFQVGSCAQFVKYVPVPSRQLC